MPKRFGGGANQVGVVPTTVSLFLIIGASDAAGMALSTGLPLRLKGPQSGVVWTVRASDAIRDWRPLQPRIITTSPTPRHGLEITFGEEQVPEYIAFDKRPAVATFSVGSTSLASWVAPGGHLEDAITYFQDHIATLVGASVIEMAGMIQFIGGQDAMSATDTAAFQANDTGLISTMRTTFSAPDMPAVLVRPSINLTFGGVPPPFLAEMRAGLAAVAASVPNTTMLSTDTYPLQADGTHLTSAGQQDLGIACASVLPPS